MKETEFGNKCKTAEKVAHYGPKSDKIYTTRVALLHIYDG